LKDKKFLREFYSARVKSDAGIKRAKTLLVNYGGLDKAQKAAGNYYGRGLRHLLKLKKSRYRDHLEEWLLFLKDRKVY